MLTIRIHGRGGQGARVACRILAAAFRRGGREVQAFASYGGEHRETPVAAVVSVDARPIRRRDDVECANHVLVLDPSLLADITPGALREDGLVLVDAPAAPCRRSAWALRVVEIDASAIADRAGLGPIVATAMLGAFAAATGLVSLLDLKRAVAAGSPAQRDANVTACVAGYLTVGGLAAPPANLARAGMWGP
jgi:2-oxoacid:acceptor oxidoreductase gamma subunit (pyruvate/2-ketoisovalerate family)